MRQTKRRTLFFVIPPLKTPLSVLKRAEKRAKKRRFGAINVNGQKVVAGSNIGEAPEKIAVELDYKWCKETNNIKDVYSGFTKYVADKNYKYWWRE